LAVENVFILIFRKAVAAFSLAMLLLVYKATKAELAGFCGCINKTEG